MAKFKNIRIKKRGGGTRTQRVKVLASGKYKFVKNISNPSNKSRSSNPRPKKAGKVKRKMAKKKRRSRKSMLTTVFKLVRLGALAAPAVHEFAFGTAAPKYKALHTIRRYTGYDFTQNKFDFANLIEGWGPYLGACLATYGIPKLTAIIRRL